MQLYFIRHAQSTNNRMYDLAGESNRRSEDPELSDYGLRQADLLANYLAYNRSQGNYLDNGHGTGVRITHLYSSLMVRSLITASVIAQTTRLPVLGWEELHERGGIYLEDARTQTRNGLPGKTRLYLEDRFPALVFPEATNPDGWWNRPYEDPPACADRAQRVLQQLVTRHDREDDCVALISHGDFYNVFLAALLGLQNQGNYWFQQNNTGITRIDFTAQGYEICYMNRLEHLPRSLIT